MQVQSVFRGFLLSVLSLVPTSPLAQDAFYSPSPEQMEQVKRLQPFPSDEKMRKAMQEQKARSQEVFRKLEPNYKGLDKVPVVQQALPNVRPQKPNLDLNGLVRQYAAKNRPLQPGKGKTDLMVFVSLSMPEVSLFRLAHQAERSGAVLVLRGLKNNSLKATAEAMRKYELHAKKATWRIDPPAFTKFGVKAVPTFVVAKSDQALFAGADGCADPGAFAAVSGDVSLDFALDEIGRTRPDLDGVAQGYLSKLQGGG